MLPWPVTSTATTSWSAFAAVDVSLVNVFVWFAVAAIASVGGYYLVVAVRRWTQREVQVETFTLQDLRDMRARGDISAQEFSAMRAALLARHTSHEEAAPPRGTTPTPPGDDVPGDET